jgi:hypothetical protein
MNFSRSIRARVREEKRAQKRRKKMERRKQKRKATNGKEVSRAGDSLISP